MSPGAELGYALKASEHAVSPFCRTAEVADAARKRGGDELGHELRVSEREIRGANSPKREAKRTSVRERRLRAKAFAQLARSVERFPRSAERRNIDVSARLPYAFDLAIR